MNEWQKTVAKYTRLHKGKSLTEILPLAKAEYRKTHKVGKIAKKHRTRHHKKHRTRHHKKRGRKQRGGEGKAMEGAEMDSAAMGGQNTPSAYIHKDLLDTNAFASGGMNGGKKSKKRHHKKKRHTKKKRGRKTR